MTLSKERLQELAVEEDMYNFAPEHEELNAMARELLERRERDKQEPVADGLIKFRKKPVVIEAVRWTGLNLHEIIAFTDGPPQVRSHHAGMMWDNYSDLVRREGLKIYTLEGVMSASIGDWIIKGVNGEFYPCKPDIFAATYEKADASVAQPVPVQDERASYEAFVEQRLVDCVDRRRAKNGDQEYMDWDMAMGWIVWQGRAAMLNGGQS